MRAIVIQQRHEHNCFARHHFSLWLYNFVEKEVVTCRGVIAPECIWGAEHVFFTFFQFKTTSLTLRHYKCCEIYLSLIRCLFRSYHLLKISKFGLIKPLFSFYLIFSVLHIECQTRVFSSSVIRLYSSVVLCTSCVLVICCALGMHAFFARHFGFNLYKHFFSPGT